MSALENIRLSTRIYIQQFVLLFALIATAVFALYSVNNIDGEIGVIRESQLPMVRALDEIRYDFRQQTHLAEQLSGFAMALSMGENGDTAQDFDNTIRQFNALDGELRDRISTTRGMLEDRLGRTGLGLVATELEEAADMLEELESNQAEYGETLRRLIDIHREEKTEEALELEQQAQIMAEHITTGFGTLISNSRELIDGPLAETSDNAGTLTLILWTVAIVVSVVGVSMALYSGLTLKSLRSAMEKIGNSIQQVATASSQSSNAITMVSDGANQQAESINQAVTAVNQSASVLGDVSKNAEDATNLARETATTVTDGREQMKDMVEVVNRISRNSGEITRITDVISNIASQTNMLSLNAAIEAARAGEHGKGFAVVADQVRKLAENSRSSVEEIVELVNQANQDAGEAVTAADRVNDEMGKIENAATETERMMQSIATSMEEQVSTSEELQNNMDTLKSIGDNNSNAAEEITQTIMELYRISEETNNEVGRFNI